MNNRVETCGKCHPKANQQFVGYLAHASIRNLAQYPVLYYAHYFMVFLLIAVFSFFGLHTVLWFFRSLFGNGQEQEDKDAVVVPPQYQGMWVRRFKATQMGLHILVMTSFIGLAVTGMCLKYSHIHFFQILSAVLGGPYINGLIHRLCALITFLYFVIHIGMLIRYFVRKEITVRGLFTEEYTMVPLLRDLQEMWQHILWFFWLKKEPRFGRWTYWEKFDYLAVFWGVAVIGISGLILWFPELATTFLPGWSINVATIIHSEEALLAVSFIFTIHFFNTHARPEKFPMDTVVFTGRVKIEEFIKERPREYQKLVDSGEFESYLTGPPSRRRLIAARFVGSVFLFMGTVTVLAIIYSAF
jgi:cytochrome b subunit of formate dehydrogenase